MEGRKGELEGKESSGRHEGRAGGEGIFGKAGRESRRDRNLREGRRGRQAGRVGGEGILGKAGRKSRRGRNLQEGRREGRK